ncbi:MAG: glycosyltransferase [Bradymonadales bacterium]|nr:MAG: glycosyltransferase [Bradymonadales bacterium]
MAQRKENIVQLTSAHPALDNRIFFKECVSLARSGYDVTLIAPHTKNEVVQGVRIIKLPVFKNRLVRWLTNPLLVFFKAIRQRARLYHFHDPELIPVGLALRLFGKVVVYDIHEDYVSSIQQKEYLPKSIARMTAPIFGCLEQLAANSFQQIIAEKYYSRRFPHSIEVLNYPKIDKLPPPATSHEGDSPRFIYTGNVTVNRGALIHANIVNLLPTAEVHFVGHCTHGLVARMQAIAGQNRSRLFFHGVDRYLPFSEIESFYQAGAWTAGLAIFPDVAHYREKELTKFFEYMAYGLPIIASNFLVWRRLIEGHSSGICIDPADTKAIVAALHQVSLPQQASTMGKCGREAVGNYLWQGQEEKLLGFYRSLLH